MCLHNLLRMARETPIIPEVVEPDEKLPRDLVALRKFAYLMDEAVRIPGTGRGIGLDAALGFIPGIGDVIGALLSVWIIIGALRHRVDCESPLCCLENASRRVTRIDHRCRSFGGSCRRATT